MDNNDDSSEKFARITWSRGKIRGGLSRTFSELRRGASCEETFPVDDNSGGRRGRKRRESRTGNWVFRNSKPNRARARVITILISPGETISRDVNASYATRVIIPRRDKERGKSWRVGN